MSRDCCVALSRGAMGLSAVCDCGISWSYSLTILYTLANSEEPDKMTQNAVFHHGPEFIKLISYSTQLSTKFILLINVKIPTIKMPTIVLTFISIINTAPERLKARNVFICRYFSFYEQLKGVCALRGYFGPLWSQKLKIDFHQFHLIGLSEE